MNSNFLIKKVKRYILLLLFFLLLFLIIFFIFTIKALSVTNNKSPNSLMQNDNYSSVDHEIQQLINELPDVDTSAWQLTLVNPWNSIMEDTEISLKQLKNGQSVDERCYPDLQEMMDDCRADGLNPYITSSYRSWDKQVKLFNNKLSRVTAQGSNDPMTDAAKVVAIPGTSEHQLGLALDIVDKNHPALDSSQEDTAVQKWLIENSWKYGFILRYPEGKSEITGIIYEPWHYRYVGKDAAKDIYEQGLCLEEYLEQIN
jgi:zinc D-Ala-D-Ala carboxypeptidase